jgi:hypothetical protein
VEITELLKIVVENVIFNMEEAEAREDSELEARKKCNSRAIRNNRYTG